MSLIPTINKFILLIAFITISNAIEPSFIYKGSGGVTDLVYQNSKLYSATAEGKIDIYDTTSQKLIQTIEVPKIKDFIGDKVASKIYSVDIIDNKIMMASQGQMGYRRVHIFQDDKLKELISIKQSYTISKAKFVNKDRLLISLLSNELILYDIPNSKALYRKQISASKFSNFVLNEDKSRVIIVDESGDLKLIDVKNGKIIKEFKGQNVDNVFQLDYKEGIIITAGQDRRCAIYSDNDKVAYYKEGTFLIYSAGLSPSGKIGAFASDENNNITLFDTTSKANLYKLGHHKATISNILFINEKELFTANDSDEINYWKLN